MFPAQALAEEMLARGWRVRLATDARGARYAGGFPPEVERRATPAATFAQGGACWSGSRRRLAIAAGAAASWLDMRRERPACVAGFGGYPALPAMIAARALEGADADPRGERRARAGEPAISRRGWTWSPAAPGRRRCRPGTRHVHTGNPVRAAVLDRHGATYVEPGDWPMGLLGDRRQPGGGAVRAGGAGGAAAAGAGRARAAQAGAAGAPRGHGPGAGGLRGHRVWRRSCAAFFDDVPERLAEATLVISRAGASSIADISVDRAAGDPDPLCARRWTTTRRRTRAGLVSAGGAFMIREEELTAEGLAGHIAAILSDPEGRKRHGAGEPEPGAPGRDRTSGGAGRGPRRKRRQA